MGVPFRGAHGALANGQILSAAQRQIDSLENENERREAHIIKRILEILRPGNEVLFSLMTDFLAIDHELMPQMVCCYETQCSNVWKIVNMNREKVRFIFFCDFMVENSSNL